jgi:hypothetical protein
MEPDGVVPQILDLYAIGRTLGQGVGQVNAERVVTEEAVTHSTDQHAHGVPPDRPIVGFATSARGGLLTRTHT